MENPQTGYLKTRSVVDGIPWRDVIYCKYGFPYKKQTRLWGFFPFDLRPICRKRDPCEGAVDGRHDLVAQQGGRNGFSLRQLYALPPELCDEIATLADVWLT